MKQVEFDTQRPKTALEPAKKDYFNDQDSVYSEEVQDLNDMDMDYKKYGERKQKDRKQKKKRKLYTIPEPFSFE